MLDPQSDLLMVTASAVTESCDITKTGEHPCLKCLNAGRGTAMYDSYHGNQLFFNVSSPKIVLVKFIVMAPERLRNRTGCVQITQCGSV